MSFKQLLLAFSSLAIVTACSDDNDLVLPVPKTNIQVVHASQDAPAVNILVNGENTIADLDFANASSRIELDAATYSVQVDGITPEDDVAVIGPVDLDLAEDQLYTAVALNETVSIEPVILSQANATPPTGQLTLQVLHAASNAPTVDVYLTAPGTDINTESPTTTLAFKDNLSPTDIDAGDYQIRITPTGSKTVVYDSGTVTLPAGLLLNVLAVTNTGPGDNPVNLIATTPDGNLTLLDSANSTDLRVFHLSPDAPAVDIIVNDGFATPLLSDVAFPNFSGFLTVPADTYNVKVVPTGTTTPVVIDADLTLEAATNYSVLAVNNLTNIEPLVISDQIRPIATEAQLRIVHASPTAGLVDLYLVAPATDITSLEANFRGVDFKQDTGILSLAAGDYDVIVTPTGSKTPAIGPAAITLNAGGVYTIIARDNAGGGAPLNVVLADDFVTQ
ncbi:DUF4397 domain-containing protein [Kangiella sp. HZ709]|uniref:DUF4397 domain-containing protein n=1 Tax=Kangiella sp. HZ709 TaxID=2666328 RepID=UPI0012AFB451|nr:DUF4397 domain-containing protein [Kangiella sp. HZ709]MRX27795.1 DUF4397 domain-containing protein [Kangiella sp. HZ709]